MQREIIKKPEILLVGISIRTSYQEEKDHKNSNIAPCVQKYFQEALFEGISNRKKPGTTFCAYTDYETNYTGAYTYFIGEEVCSLDKDLPKGLRELIIPSQKYVKFTTPRGLMPDVVVNAWKDIWEMSSEELSGNRSYISDFEIYDQRACDPKNTILDIYIGIDS